MSKLSNFKKWYFYFLHQKSSIFDIFRAPDSLLLCSYVSVARFTADRAVRFGRLAAHARRWLSGSWAHPRQERTADKCDRPRHAGGPQRPLLGRLARSGAVRVVWLWTDRSGKGNPAVRARGGNPSGAGGAVLSDWRCMEGSGCVDGGHVQRADRNEW